MSTMTPYSGSLLRLAFTTIAIIGILAVALALWERRAAGMTPRTSTSRVVSATIAWR